MPAAKSKTRMKLARYRCKELTLRLTTDKENFSAKKFFSDPRVSKHVKDWEKGAPLEFLHYTGNPRVSDYHVHTRVELDGSDVELYMRWTTPTARRTRKSTYPFAEDASAWISRLFKNNVFLIRCSAYYLFPRSRYMSTLGIPMPLWIESPARGTQTISGMRVRLPLSGARDASVVTDTIDDELFVKASAVFKMRLSQARPEGLLVKFSRLVEKFVREKRR